MDFQFEGKGAIEPWPLPTLLGRLSFTYVTPLVEKGLKFPVEQSDLWVGTSSPCFTMSH